MLRSATPTGKPATRRRAYKLFGLTLILLTFALALPAGASAYRSSGGAWAGATGNVTGTVTNASAAGLAGIAVDAYRANGPGNWEWVSYTPTDADGAYRLGGLPTGSYVIEFRDDSGVYVRQCYNNKPSRDEADAVAVTAGQTTSGINATLAPAGGVSGAVTNASAAGLGGIFVVAYLVNSSGWDWINSVQTGADGTYSLGGLPAGSYRVEFRDDAGAYATQYYNNKPTGELGDDVVVTVGATTPGINATLLAAGAPTVTLKLSGLSGGALKLGKSVTAAGAVTPTSLAGKVTLTVQMKKGSSWIKAKTASVTIIFGGTYNWKYTPAKKGTYQMQAKIAKTDAHAAAASKWLAFTVK